MTKIIPGTVLRRGRPPAQAGHPGHGYLSATIEGVQFERDVPVTMRDGTVIYIDLFRPVEHTSLPTIVGWAPFGKHPHLDWDTVFPGADVPPGTNSPQTPFEAVDPIAWAQAGYAVINADPRGTWYSEGIATFMTEQEGEDEYDLIEWAGTQEWSNGRVGLAGVSYFSMSAYQAAALRPPHLTAMMLNEALCDFYRDVKFHGGIPAWYLTHSWMSLVSNSIGEVEDIEDALRDHPLYDDYWKAHVADFSRIEVPTYVVCGWSNHGIHTRGTLDAYGKLGSSQKWLELHGFKEWAFFYADESRKRQREFFDHFLLDRETGVAEWPPVRLEVREAYNLGTTRSEQEYPLARTSYERFDLDGVGGTLSRSPLPHEHHIAYAAADGRAFFDLTFSERTELVGPAKLKLWVAAQGSDDADLFVALKKLDADRNEVGFAYLGMFDNGPVALGWLRVSHRELDELKSTPERPWHRHEREVRLDDEEPVAVEIAIHDSGTVFEAGQTLRLVIQGHDVHQHDAGFALRHAELRNRGLHVLYTGGPFDSHLLLPVVPDVTSVGAGAELEARTRPGSRTGDGSGAS